MAEHYEDSRHEEALGEILDALERGDFRGVRRVLDGMHPADIALLQTRTLVLDDTLRAKFRSWYSGLFHVQTPGRG